MQYKRAHEQDQSCLSYLFHHIKTFVPPIRGEMAILDITV